MTKNKRQIDFFGDGMRIFLDYIARQLKKNPDYKPHPIIRAFECAMQGIEKCEEGKCTMGVSQDGTEKSVYEPYIVVLQKMNNGIEVKEIRNVKVDKQLPTDIMVIIFRLQIQLDKIEGNTVNPQQMVDALNAVIPGNKFYALGDRWKEARNKFKELLEQGKMYLPRDPEIIEELKSIKYETPWEDYSNKLRALIGSSISQTFDNKGGIVTITSPTNSKIEKYKVFDSATEFMIGKSAEYLKPFENKEETT
jgi:hypothetical protein